MSMTTTRRDILKTGAGLVIGATLAAGAAPAEAADEAAARPDMAAIFAWEDATTAADARGLAWVTQAETLRTSVQLAVWAAEEVGDPRLLDSLRAALVDADALHAKRAAIFQAWADEAWSLPELASWPREPWA